jgi:hypothetical protein
LLSCKPLQHLPAASKQHHNSNGFAFGENSAGYSNPFIGTGDFALSNTKTNTRSDSSWHLFFFHWAFSAAAATIVAGAVAERIAFECYMGYTCLMTSFVSTTAEADSVLVLGRAAVYVVQEIWQIRQCYMATCRRVMSFGSATDALHQGDELFMLLKRIRVRGLPCCHIVE